MELAKSDLKRNLVSSELSLLRSSTERISVRKYGERDLYQVIDVYKSAFSNPPYNEFMKCLKCGIEYGKHEVVKNNMPDVCKSCNSPLELEEFWTSKDVTENLKYSTSQPNPITLVSHDETGITGFMWGYNISFNEFPFLQGVVLNNASYIAELGVREDRVRRGIATVLCNEYLETLKNLGVIQAVLRTHQNNVKALSLYRKMGFTEIPDPKNINSRIYDPIEKERIFLSRSI